LLTAEAQKTQRKKENQKKPQTDADQMMDSTI